MIYLDGIARLHGTSLFVEIENLLGRVNVRGRDLRYDPIENRYYYHQETGMPRVPSFGLEVSWGG